MYIKLRRFKKRVGPYLHIMVSLSLSLLSSSSSSVFQLHSLI